LSAVELAAVLRRRELSPIEALDAVLLRAERVASEINPFAVELKDRARSAAVAAEAALARGDAKPLTGVPITVKDSHWLAGVSSAVGSRAQADFVPKETSAAVERLEAAGAVIFAKTATPEFCYFGITESPLNGRTSNPWNVDRTPGGSSGGAGAAVAAGLGPLALGGDGGGSIRIPAAFCGVVGFKPTFGLVPREPCSPAWKTLVAYGPIARSVADARLMVRVMAGWHPRDRHSLAVSNLDAADPKSGRVRAAVSEDLGFAPVDDDVRRAFRRALDGLEGAGVDLVEDEPGIGSSVAAWTVIAAAEARVAEAAVFERRRVALDPATAALLAFGEQISAGAYIDAQNARERLHRAYADLFERTGASVLLTPALGCEAFEHGTTYPATIGGRPVEAPWRDWCGFLYDANLAGLSACAVPIGLGDDHLPVALQVVGLRCADATVLDFAALVERVVGFEPLALRAAPAAVD
jgi:Asp-tRNA(Asn)/Glu-tRNA(Gln) amidotransferase A subunit family amidase